MFDLSLQSSVAEVEAALRENNVFSYPAEYAKDHHFEKYVFDTIQTEADARLFCLLLDRQRIETGASGECTKAWRIRSYLNKTFWLGSPGRIRAAMSHARRTCCWCHEVGSFRSLKVTKNKIKLPHLVIHNSTETRDR